ncbi:MAG TPA: hypothetical protein VNR68_09585 [Sphingomicrobium sp.]|nr:hypothetical protein [Sphingomicrobium sp.]
MEISADISLRPFDRVVEEGYRRLFPGEPDKAPDVLKWRFQDNPHGRAKFAAAMEGDDLVGMIALVPTRLVNTAACSGYQAVDTAVEASQRGKGLFVKIGNAAQAQMGGDILWGFPYAAPLQAGQPVTVTSSCNATSTWLAASTNQPPPPAQRGERGK